MTPLFHTRLDDFSKQINLEPPSYDLPKKEMDPSYGINQL
ncbi:unnamed protein product [Acidithrix sp. C25]|nr:unnamed protein product [Acidithrix sp. C25]